MPSLPLGRQQDLEGDWLHRVRADRQLRGDFHAPLGQRGPERSPGRGLEGAE